MRRTVAGNEVHCIAPHMPHSEGVGDIVRYLD
jgi:hypothetical protein